MTEVDYEKAWREIFYDDGGETLSQLDQLGLLRNTDGTLKSALDILKELARGYLDDLP